MLNLLASSVVIFLSFYIQQDFYFKINWVCILTVLLFYARSSAYLYLLELTD